MGNLFRCVPNLDRNEYILKVGATQGSYNYKTLTYKQGSGSFSYSASSVQADVYASSAVYYNFDASKWNKIHITQLRASNSSGYGVIGVCTTANPSVYSFEDSDIKKKVYVENGVDVAFDISKLTGECSFFMFVKTDGGTNSSYAKISISGNVYLSEE